MIDGDMEEDGVRLQASLDHNDDDDEKRDVIPSMPDSPKILTEMWDDW